MTAATGTGTVVQDQESHRRGSDISPCGTPAAARRHHRHHEPLDPACREAFRRYHREYRRAARQIEAFRRRENAATARWEQRASTDPAWVEKRRQQRRARTQLLDGPDIDPVAVARFVAGDSTVPLNHDEKLAAYAEMLRRGIPHKHVTARLRISGTTARRYADELARTANLPNSPSNGRPTLEEATA